MYDLKNKPKEFSLMPIVYEYYNCISQIIDEVRFIGKKTLEKSLLIIKKTIDLFSDYDSDSQLCVFYNFEYSSPNSYENSKFDILTIPMNLILEIKNDLNLEE